MHGLLPRTNEDCKGMKTAPQTFSTSMMIKPALASIAALFLASCANKDQPQWLMPTPVLYLDGRVDPFAHLPPSERGTKVDVFYTTNRQPASDHYSNNLDDRLRYGRASMVLGENDDTWSSLVDASTTHPRKRPMPVRLDTSSETGDDTNEAAIKAWAADVDQSLRRTATRDIVIYVHGAKVGFHHSCAFTAELDHFSGRDFTPVAFDWPTHQDIFSYIDRVDLDHARRSSSQLAETIRILADRTSVRRIHIVSWSAGARVHSRALAELAEGGVTHARKRYRLGVQTFAAGDVPVEDFLERLPAIHGLGDRVLVYMSDADGPLKWAARLMGGGRRLGLAPGTLNETELAALKSMPRLEVIDVSYGKQRRGFDITGHRYWFQHPWANSDLVLALRTGAAAPARGLLPAPAPGVWYFGDHYPQRIGPAARQLTGGKW
jgi:esterase/lipase superfamily enzyme